MPLTDLASYLPAKSPWREVTIPNPPQNASPTQLFDFGSLAGLVAANGGKLNDVVMRTTRAYVEKWKVNVELPE